MRLKLNIVSTYRAQIYGFAILWILVFHGGAINSCDFSFGVSGLGWLNSVIGVGNVGVDIFLFLSGISLYFSFTKDPDYRSFIKKRLQRVAIPALAIYFIYWIVRYAFLQPNVIGLLSRFTLMRFWMTGDQTMWFISAILVLYFIYPYIYAFIFGGKHANLRFAILLALTYLAIYLFSQQAPELYELWEIALTRIPVFIIGSWFGKFVYDKREVNPAWAILILIGVVAFAYVMHAGMLDGMAKRLFYAVGGISGCYALALVFLLFDKIPIVGKGLNLFFGFFGAFTLELYCTQGMLNQILRMLPIYEVGNVGQFAIMAVCAIILAWIAMKLCNALIRQLKKSAAPEPKQ